MKVPYKWLKEYVDIDVSVYALANDLLNIGFEVEEIIDLSEKTKKVFVGKIIKITPHPNADKLRICSIDMGNEILQIVTAAKNVQEGDVVPVSTDGAKLPNGKEIFSADFRGVFSMGMLCSGEELCLKEEDYPNAGFDGIMTLPNDTKLGADINEIIGTDDFVLDISITANRPDCQSIFGIAREVAAIYKLPLKMPDISYPTTKEGIELKITNVAFDLCPHYMAGCVKDVIVKRSPNLISSRLRSVGIRPINNIVDITNYILIELGQPMHAFDKRNICGDTIKIRKALNDEIITTLDGKVNTLKDSMLVIADSDKPNALAGIMGGANSLVQSDTKEIVFESAKFARDNIRRTSKALNIRSDSSARFEKGIDFGMQEFALKRAFNLISATNSGKILEETLESCISKPKNEKIVILINRVKQILGIDINDKFILDTLNNLTINAKLEGDNLIAVIPSYREDIVGANDIAEEIIRFYGYDHINPTLLDNSAQTLGVLTKKQRNTKNIFAKMIGMGLNEITTYSFITPKAFDLLLLDESNILRNAAKLVNPLSEDWSTMRTMLSHSMLSTIANNSKKNNKFARFFEVANVYIPNSLPMAELPKEINKLCIGIYGEEESFFTIKGIIEALFSSFNINFEVTREIYRFLHNGRSASIISNSTNLGYLGEVHPDVLVNYGINSRAYIAEINIDAMLDMITDEFIYKSIPKYPSVERDFALVLKEDVAIGEVLNFAKTYHDLVEEVKIFDIYRGGQVEAGYKSVAINIIFRSNDKTLKESDIQQIVEPLIKDLSNNYDAKLRY